MSERLQIGVDLGGTKIAVSAFGPARQLVCAKRARTPQGSYDGTIETIAGLIEAIEGEQNKTATVGVGMPGSISPVTGRVQNANSTWLNGRPMDRDLNQRLGRIVRFANDANCFALSEAVDGAAAGARLVFGVIIGTGCGGGLVADGRIINGPRGIGGEWGHNPLPWPEAAEFPGPICWCGRRGCMEVWVSGPGLASDHCLVTGETLQPEAIFEHSGQGDKQARQSLDRHASRLARGLAGIINIFDPDVIVLGGGLSNLSSLYDVLPSLIAPHIFSDNRDVDIRPPDYGDASGVRGAAWLWNEQPLQSNC